MNNFLEQEQMEWILKHGIENKDSQEDITPHYYKKSKKCLKKHSFHQKQDIVDFEIDLHGCSITEALAKIEITMLTQSSFKIIRIIHGKSNHSIHSINYQVKKNLQTKWKQKIVRFNTDPYNEGSSIVILK